METIMQLGTPSRKRKAREREAGGGEERELEQ
jgi:hypothetical protein